MQMSLKHRRPVTSSLTLPGILDMAFLLLNKICSLI